jgi:hypothetical protein
MEQTPPKLQWPFLLFLAVVFSGLQACAPLTAPREKALPLSPEQLWADFQNTFGPRPDTHFWLKSSLNYSGPEESHRSTFELWGDCDLPLRLDLKASLGITISLWRIGKQGLVAYYPRKEIAYTAKNSKLGLKALGLYFPLNVHELASIATGQGATIVPSVYARAESQDQGHMKFIFTGQSKIQTMALDAQGRIKSLSGHNPYSWTFDVEDYEMENTIDVPHTWRLTTAAEHRAVVRIKEIHFRSLPWPEKALSLTLPEGTTHMPLGE